MDWTITSEVLPSEVQELESHLLLKKKKNKNYCALKEIDNQLEWLGKIIWFFVMIKH